jgi:hypothetical protein
LVFGFNKWIAYKFGLINLETVSYKDPIKEEVEEGHELDNVTGGDNKLLINKDKKYK